MNINPEIIDRIQRQALGQFLSSYPHDMEYDDILQRLIDGELDANDESEDDDDDESGIVIWEPFENHPTESVAEYIEETFDSLIYCVERMFQDRLIVEVKA